MRSSPRAQRSGRERWEDADEDRARGGRRSSGGSGRSLDYSYSQSHEYAGGEGEVGPGTRVTHPIFGAGSVLSVIGTGPSQKLKIRFDRAGVKTVMLRYANLELG